MQKFSNPSKTFSVRNSKLSLENPRFSVTSTKLDSGSRLVSTIRNRSNASEVQINPELASKVVREYILPIFDKETKEKSHSKRRASYGIQPTRHRYSSSFDGTLYTELKMSEQLSGEMRKLQEENFSIKNQLKDLKQSQFMIQEKLTLAEEQVVSLETTVRCLNFENLKLESRLSTFSLELEKSKQQVNEFEKHSKELALTRDFCERKLHDEKANNDIRYSPKFSLTPQTS